MFLIIKFRFNWASDDVPILSILFKLNAVRSILYFRLHFPHLILSLFIIIYPPSVKYYILTKKLKIGPAGLVETSLKNTFLNQTGKNKSSR